MSAIVRQHELLSLTLDSQIADTPQINIGGYASGQIIIPTGSAITSLTYHVAEKIDGTYVAAQDSAGSPVTQTVGAAKAYPLPSAVMGAVAIKIVTNADGAVFLNLKG